MDKETILKRIELLRKEREITIANVNAYNGAIQEAEYWLKQLDKPEDKKE